VKPKALKKYKDYQGSIEFDLNSGLLHGKILFIRDDVTYEGLTLDELTKQFRLVVDDYIDTCRDLNRDPQRPFSGTFNVRINPVLHYRSAQYAYALGVSLNEYIRQSLEESWNNHHEKIVRHEHIHKHTIFQSEVQHSDSQSSSATSQSKIQWQTHRQNTQKSH